MTNTRLILPVFCLYVSRNKKNIIHVGSRPIRIREYVTMNNIVCINRHCAQKSIPSLNLNRNWSGGGAVLYIRESLSCIDRDDLMPDRLEMLCAEIIRPFSKSILSARGIGL